MFTRVLEVPPPPPTPACIYVANLSNYFNTISSLQLLSHLAKYVGKHHTSCQRYNSVLSFSLSLSLSFSVYLSRSLSPVFYRCEWVKKLGTEGTKSFLKILSIGFGKHSRDTYSLCVEIFYCSFIYNCFESFTGWVVAYIITPSPLSQYPDDPYHEKRNRKGKKNPNKRYYSIQTYIRNKDFFLLFYILKE